MEDKRIPVTILTGFLGSGKTTLLNRIVKENNGRKIAIIENEYGETSIDSELVVGASEGVFELSNGCLCCSLNGDLVDLLNKLLKQSNKMDHLIVETTGIADPGPITMCFLSDYTIQSSFRLNSIVTLVDAQHIEQQLENHPEAGRQVASADLIILNKTDKVDSYMLDTVTNIIKRLNPLGEILTSQFGVLSNKKDLLELNSFHNKQVVQSLDKGINKFNNLKPVKDSSFSGSILGTTKEVHHSTINSLSFEFEEPLEPLKFKIWIDLILNIKSCPVYRSKGILSFKDLDDKIVFQAVNNQFVTESGGEWESSSRKSKLVFIGKNLPQDLFAKGIKACTDHSPFDPREFYNAIN